MKAYIGIKFREDNSNKEMIEGISSVLEQRGFQTVCMARDVEQWGRVRFEPQTLMRRTFEEIDSSDVVVIDLTEKGVGLGIEAGYAYAKGIPIVTVARNGSDISAILKGVSQKIFLYEKHEELSECFKGHSFHKAGPMTVREIQENAKEISVHFEKKTPEQRVLYLMTEVGEVAEEVLQISGGRRGDAEKAKGKLGMEIYDVVWNLCDLANILGIDLEDAFTRKMQINKSRW